MNKRVGVPACRECNQLLRAKLYLTVGERAGYLSRILAKRYAKLLATPKWDADELAELGYGLQQTIRQSLIAKQDILTRIAYCELTHTVAPTLADVWSEIKYDDGVPD